MLSRSEKLCKYGLLFLFLLSIEESIRILISQNLIYTFYDLDAILCLFLTAAVFQGIIGIVGWIMLCHDNERGKNLIVINYGISFGLYGLCSLYFLITFLFPAFFIVYPFANLIIFGLCIFSGVVLLLQHFWTRYII